MLKPLSAFVLAMCLAVAGLMAGCATDPNAAAMSLNQRLALGDQLVQTVQKASTAALRAGRMSVAQDQEVQAGVGIAHGSLVTAKQLALSDPAAAAAAVDKALADLSRLQGKLPPAPNPPASTPATSKVPS